MSIFTLLLQCLGLQRGALSAPVWGDWAATRWKLLNTWAGGACEIAPGFDIADAKWQRVEDPATGAQRWIDVLDPLYGKPQRLAVWIITVRKDTRMFAAGEVSNGVFLVFVPDPPPA